MSRSRLQDRLPSAIQGPSFESIFIFLAALRQTKQKRFVASIDFLKGDAGVCIPIYRSDGHVASKLWTKVNTLAKIGSKDEVLMVHGNTKSRKELILFYFHSFCILIALLGSARVCPSCTNVCFAFQIFQT